MTQFNQEPVEYCGPRTVFEKLLVKYIFSKILPSVMIALDGSPTALDGTEYVLRPPTLIQTLRMLAFPDFWVGEYYARGKWYLSKGELSPFIGDAFLLPPPRYRSYFRFVSGVRGPFFRLRRYLLDPLESRQTATHYNLEYPLYESFLDEQMLYTCAFFAEESDSLETAQDTKLRLVLERLKLSSAKSNVLDIGSGWGGLDRYLVTKSKSLKVTGISLAQKQIEYAEMRNRSQLTLQQSSRIQYVKSDFFEFQPKKEKFDGLVAIGMFEHVGARNHRPFAIKARDLLEIGGRCLVHTIVAPERDRQSNKWIDTHIFPGGYAPSLAELVEAFEIDGMLIEAVHIHSGRNYVKTIESWLQRFCTNWVPEHQTKREQIFNRHWYFYLSAVKNMFDEHVLRHQVAHIVIKRL